MNKNELVAAVAEKGGLTKADAGTAVDAVLAAVTGALKAGEEVRLPASAFSPFRIAQLRLAVTLRPVWKLLFLPATCRSSRLARA